MRGHQREAGESKEVKGMSGLRRTDTPLSSTARILGLLDDLAEDLNTVDLDTIDGEFYWKACRVDLLDRVADLCNSNLTGSKPRDSSELLKTQDSMLGFLRQSLLQAHAVHKVETQAATLYPSSVWRRLIAGERVAMRAAEAEMIRSAGERQTLTVKVYSGAWSGADVEAEVFRQGPDWTQWLDGKEEASAQSEVVSLSVEFSFSDEQSAPASEGGAYSRDCYVRVGIPLPGPPPGVISREYEALVRQQRAWHLRLLGGGSRQDKEVALRTWAVGLLLADGTRFAEAMRLVSGRKEVGEVSQTRFGQDRQKLVERVPEAKSFLFQRSTTILPQLDTSFSHESTDEYDLNQPAS
jgi:hypothetical protein